MCPDPQFTADLVTFIKEIRNGKPHFLRSDSQNRQLILRKDDCASQ